MRRTEKNSKKKALEKQTEREVNSFMKQQGELDNTLGSRMAGALSDLDIDEETKEEPPPKQ